METIRNYLESMFSQLPNTPEVLKAKYELGQMMEDKYSELIADGKSENEVIGTIIAEFGNLDELAESLGIGNLFIHKISPLTPKHCHTMMQPHTLRQMHAMHTA